MLDLLLQLSPGIVMIFGGLLLLFVRNGFLQRVLSLLLPLLVLGHIWLLSAFDGAVTVSFGGFDLMPVYRHAYTNIFATIFALVSFAGVLFGLFQSRLLETVAGFVYGGCAIGVTYAGDFVTLFLFWEGMAIGSSLVIWAAGSESARKSGMRYIAMHLLGGVLLMVGIAGTVALNGSLQIVPFDADMFDITSFATMNMQVVATGLVLLGILVNAAAPPFSSWLPDSYPESSPFGAVYLSAFTTKAAVFVLITLFAGFSVLIYVGLFMVFYGIVMAMLENDMRRILAYSVINQVGFMVTGVGIGTDMALYGSATHAFCHIIYKALLFMSAGSVLYMTGKRKCTDLGGLYRYMPWSMWCGVIGALSISAFPLTSGFVSKSMVSYAAMHEHMPWVWFLLLMATAGVFLHAGIKFPWFVFFNKDSGMKPKDPPLNMKLAMFLCSVLCIVLALPSVTEVTLYKLLPAMPEYSAYSAEHVVRQLQLLAFSGLAFFVMLRLLRRTETISLDFDVFYRRIAPFVIRCFSFLGVLLWHGLRAIGGVYYKRGGNVILLCL